ncbi:MAG: pantoate--beta-alanine ligase [Myxococcota bacterium]|nr:pantoate--beta-alanine ligase [Myxococcota bacterium]
MSQLPIVYNDISSVRNACDRVRGLGRSVALVPTMGALHKGHLALVDAARKTADYVVVSIFVNPTQFGPGEDLDRYPRDLDGDIRKLATCGTDAVFAPTPSVMYPDRFHTAVIVSHVTEGLCGAGRPTHFRGVATVVTKLFNIVGPCLAVFGRKDYQQLQVIKQTVSDLNMPVQIIPVPTVREADGLAMSSRNAYLARDDRLRARTISSGLAAAHSKFEGGERNVGVLRRAVAEPVSIAADRVEYVTAADPISLESIPDQEAASDKLLIAVAAHFGKTRLIDNTVLGEDTPPTTQ